jgi:hypothetical protein
MKRVLILVVLLTALVGVGQSAAVQCHCGCSCGGSADYNEGTRKCEIICYLPGRVYDPTGKLIGYYDEQHRFHSASLVPD